MLFSVRSFGYALFILEKEGYTMEEKIIEAKFVKNTNAFIIGIFGLLFFMFGMVEIYTGYLSDLQSAYSRPANFGYYFRDSLGLFFSYWGNSGGYLVYLGMILVIAFVVIFFMMRKGKLSVYSAYVTGKASFGKQVDLPLSQISAISLGTFKSLTVATSAGSLHFWLIQNRDEVYNALSKLLSDSQNNSAKTIASTIFADELRKYKELLDEGVITQEEFDAKKKQLLGL
jgi:hypothetical protein